MVEFKASLAYTIPVSSRTTRTVQRDPVSNKQNKGNHFICIEGASTGLSELRLEPGSVLGPLLGQS